VPSRKTRVIGRKLDCLNPNPQRCKRTPAATAPERSATRGRSFAFCGPQPPPGKAMASEAIEGDEWGAYVTLDTFSTNGTRDRLPDASPKATESP
jgi:hypothetical protein